MEVKIQKLHPNAVIPTYAKEGDAGLDITSVSVRWDAEKELYVYGTGIALEIPKGYVGLIFPRSSIIKTSLILSNSVGVIDSGFRGEIKFMFRRVPLQPERIYSVGDRIGQIIITPYPQITFISTSELSASERGSGGFGHTGA